MKYLRFTANHPVQKTISLVVAVTFALAAVPASAQAGPPAPGAPVGNEFTVNPPPGGSQAEPAVAMDAEGDFVVVWTGGYGTYQEYSNVYGQRYDAAGTPLGSRFQVNVPQAFSIDADPAVAMDAKGNFVVVWDDVLGTFAQRYDADGAPRGSVFQVAASPSNAPLFPSVAMDADGDFVVAWEGTDGDGQGILARRYDADGRALGSPFQVNTHTSGQQTSPALAMDVNGDFVVAWTDLSGPDDWDVFARRFDAADDTPAGAELLVNTHTSGRQLWAAVAMNAAGSFVIAWTDQSGADGDGCGVFGQRYAADGTPLGSEFRVNTQTKGDQDDPAVAMGAAGGFAVAWTDDSGVDPDIFARRYDADGTPLDSAFRVNAHTSYAQVTPAVAMSAAGGSVIAWEDPDGILAQRYARVSPLDLEGTLAVAPDDTVNAGGTVALTVGINNIETPITRTGYAIIDKALTTATGLTATIA